MTEESETAANVELSDNTPIRVYTWKMLKHHAMTPSFNAETFDDFTPEESQKIKTLIRA